MANMILTVKRSYVCEDEVMRRADCEMATFHEGAEQRREYSERMQLRVPTRVPMWISPRFEDVPPVQMHACWIKHFTLVLIDDAHNDTITHSVVQLCMAWRNAQIGSRAVKNGGAVTK